MHIDLDALKASVSIVALAGRCGFTVVRKGQTTYTTAEHDSLVLFPNDNSWHRFATGDGGDVVDFLTYWQKCDFKTAVEQLQGIAAIAPCPVVHVPPPPPPPPLKMDLAYNLHRQMGSSGWDWWRGEGLSERAIRTYILGECRHHYYGLCYSIPVIEDDKLMDLRLRLTEPDRIALYGKYRPWRGGYGRHLFNRDVLKTHPQGVIVVAGEKKAMVLSDFDITAVSPTAGCSNWLNEWTPPIMAVPRRWVAYDPKETKAAKKVATILDAKIVLLPDNPDDFLLREGVAAFHACVRAATTVAEHDAWEKARQQSERMVRV